MQVTVQGHSEGCRSFMEQECLTTLKMWFSPPVPAGRATTRTGESALLCMLAHVCKRGQVLGIGTRGDLTAAMGWLHQGRDPFVPMCTAFVCTGSAIMEQCWFVVKTHHQPQKVCYNNILRGTQCHSCINTAEGHCAALSLNGLHGRHHIQMGAPAGRTTAQHDNVFRVALGGRISIACGFPRVLISQMHACATQYRINDPWLPQSFAWSCSAAMVSVCAHNRTQKNSPCN